MKDKAKIWRCCYFWEVRFQGLAHSINYFSSFYHQPTNLI